GAWLCVACRTALSPLPEPGCRCGRPQARETDSCSVCDAWPADLGPIRAAFAFSGPMRTSVHRFKYRGEHARGRYLGGLLADVAHAMFASKAERPDLILP